MFLKVAGIAQLAEQLICNQEVGGSNPSSGTTFKASAHPRPLFWHTERRYIKTIRAKKHTVAEMIDRYIAAVGDDKKDAKTQAGQLQWWKERIGGYSLADATPALILEHRDQLGSETTNRGAIRRPGHREPDVGRIVCRLHCRR